MSLMNTKNTFGSIAKILHWLMATLVIMQFAMVYYKHYYLPSQDPFGTILIKEFHKPIGVIILSLVLFRIIWRFINIQPAYNNTVPIWEQYIAKIVHYFLYVTMVVMPLSGIIMTLASGYSIDMFGYYKISGILELNKTLGGTAFNIHQYCSYFMLTIIVLHIAGAYFNHFINKNNVLKRMLP